LLVKGETIYNELCFSCHGSDGRGAPMAGAPAGTMMAPPLAGSPRVQGHRDYVTNVLLHGLTGELNAKTYTQVMVPMGQKDDWIAAIASYVRNTFGNTGGSFTTVADVARVRTATANRKMMWTAPELEATLPVLLPAQPTWKATASHSPATAQGALSLTGWNSGAPQEVGMWIQIEFPEPLSFSEVQFGAPGAGRAGAPPAAPRAAGSAPAAPAVPVPAGAAAQGAPGGVGTPGGGRGGGPGVAPLREYQIQTSMDGKKWSAPVARGPLSALTVAAFAPVKAKFVRITETAAGPNLGPLSIQNIRLYQAASK
ncbi:MAG: c-type cytochrome, partial [Acidobacteriota bacterium]